MSDLRHTWRALAKSPGTATLAVLSLALGIAGSTAVFSLMDAVQWRALPVREPSQLRLLGWSGPWPKAYRMAGEEAFFTAQGGNYFGEFSYPAYEALHAQAAGQAEVFAFARTDPLTVHLPGGAVPAAGLLVSGNFFRGYGAGVTLGRPLEPEDDRADAAPAVVVTHRWWERQLGADPAAIGRVLSLNRRSFTLVGVLPRGFAGPLARDEADFYLPMAAQPAFRAGTERLSSDDYWVQVLLRLPRNGQEAQARAALEVAFQRHQAPLIEAREGSPRLLWQAGHRGPRVQRAFLAGPLQPLARLALLALLLGCANTAGLLLARHAARQPELAVRAALGASRWRLAGSAMTEGLCLALAGTALGLVLAGWARAALIRLLPALQEHSALAAGLDLRSAAFALGVAGLAALVTGLPAALQAARVRPALRCSWVLGGPRLRLGRWLAIAQIALTIVLLAGAGLVTRSWLNLRHVDLGFEANGLLVFRLNAAQAGYAGEAIPRLYDRIRDEVLGLPGVRAAAFADQPQIGANFGTGYRIEFPGLGEPSFGVGGMVVSADYWSTLGIPLQEGRAFGPDDSAASERVAVVNRAFVDRLPPGRSPLGLVFQLAGRAHRIVGVCANARQYDLRQTPSAAIYVAERQTAAADAWFMVRTEAAPLALATAVRQAVHRVEPQLAVADLTTQRALADRLLATERLLTQLGGGLALLALLLSCLGVYGLLSYQVSRRIPEIGLRMALGAQPAAVARWVLGDAARLASIGVAAGGLAFVGAVRAIRGYLFGVGPQDPTVLLGATLALFLVALAAAALPARRAARVDPLLALRSE